MSVVMTRNILDVFCKEGIKKIVIQLKIQIYISVIWSFFLNQNMSEWDK